MMDQELLPASSNYDVDLEEGELSSSSEEVYIPLQRPDTNTAKSNSPLATCHKMQTALSEPQQQDEDDSPLDSDSSSGESSEGCLKKLQKHDANSDKKRKKVRRTVMVRQNNDSQDKKARFKKYNIWTLALQEDALTETMRGCDVTRNPGNDRNVENYDFSLRYRLNGENSLKRRLSNSTDDYSDSSEFPASKRGRKSSGDDSLHKKSVKNRLDHKYMRRGSDRRSNNSPSGSDCSNEPKHISDLDDDVKERSSAELAKELASKLQEEKDDLLNIIVDVLGNEIPIELYKETQRIEADGGMMIKNGRRRRTPGGVFLFLLKHHDSITPEQQKAIFQTDRQNTNQWKKKIKSQSRDRKVEELKKRLNEQEREMPALSTRKDHYLLGSELVSELQSGALSNPPPSPVAFAALEQNNEILNTSPLPINHVAAVDDSICQSSNMPSTSATALAELKSASPAEKLSLKENNQINYDDDFLDINCTDMDLF